MFNRLLNWLFGSSSSTLDVSHRNAWENVTVEYKRGRDAIAAIKAFVNDTSDFHTMIDDSDVYFCQYRGKADFSNHSDNKAALKARNWYATQLIEMGMQVDRFSDSYVSDGTKFITYTVDFQHPDWLQIRKASGLYAKQVERQAAKEEQFKRDMEAYKKRLAEDDGNVRGRYIHDKAAIDALKSLLGEEILTQDIKISTRIYKGDRRGSISVSGINNTNAKQVRDSYAKLLNEKGYSVKRDSSSYVVDGDRNVTYSVDFHKE